jgi:hypothetical protein
MSLVVTFAWVRTNIRGEPDQLNYLSHPCETVERGNNTGTVAERIKRYQQRWAKLL